MEDTNENTGQIGLQERVLTAGICTGCGACVNICPYQATYRDSTIILHQCDLDMGKCYSFCPRTHTDLDNLRQLSFNEIDLTPEIGAIKGFYVTRATDKEVRKNAQHGGTVTTLMALALQEGIIETSVIAESQEDFMPHSVMVSDPHEVKKRGRSNFIISPTVAEFNKAAKTEFNKIGVVATPCQALALAKMRFSRFPTGDNNIDKLKLIIGLFCGWAFSWSKIVELLSKKTDLDAITGMDIPPSKYHALEVYTKNGTIDVSLDEVNPCVRDACHYCFDMTAEFSDISVGSARLPEGWEVARGWNQVIVRTQLGNELIQLAKARGVLEFRDVPEDNLEKLKHASMNKKRMAIKNLIDKSGSSDDLLYLDIQDSVLCKLLG